MPDETKPPMNTKPADTPSAGAAASVTVQKFRVLHGAVSGNGRNKKGEKVEQDYYTGAIVTAEQLDNNEGHYLTMGAIARVDE